MKHFLFFLLACSALYAEPEIDGNFLSSTTASFDGNSLLLQGHVMLDHGIGKLSAEKASLQRQEAGKDFPFSLIELHKDVLLKLNTQATLACDHAHLDFASLKAVLNSIVNSPVVYQDNQKQPLKIVGNVVEINMLKEENNSKTEYQIESLTAKQNIHVTYGDVFTLLSDVAIFEPNTVKKRQLHAFPESANGTCVIENKEGKINAMRVDVFVDQEELQMEMPNGVLNMTSGQKILFASQGMLWNQKDSSITLKENVKIEDPFFGKISAKDRVIIAQGSKKGKKSFQTIQTKGEATLVYQQQNNLHKLTCFGTLKLDRERSNATAESPSSQGVVASVNQIHYEEESMSAFSDKANMEYSIIGNHFQPISVTLKGNVRLISHDENKPARCARADRVTYSPSTRTFILAANPGSKVLLWDEADSRQISAQEIHITQESGDQKETIKGVGNVTFTLSNEEHLLLQKLFPQYNIPE
jgi:hypothetical protein